LLGENHSQTKRREAHHVRLTDYITEQNWEDTLIATYVLVADRPDRAAQAARFIRTLSPELEYDARSSPSPWSPIIGFIATKKGMSLL
jgi:hypothetical protein